MKINFKPTGDRILAKRIYKKIETVTNSFGFITTASAQDIADIDTQGKLQSKPLEEATMQALVVRVGKKVEEVKEGDTVYYNGRATPIKHLDEEYILFKEGDVNGIIEY